MRKSTILCQGHVLFVFIRELLIDELIKRLDSIKHLSRLSIAIDNVYLQKWEICMHKVILCACSQSISTTESRNSIIIILKFYFPPFKMWNISIIDLSPTPFAFLFFHLQSVQSHLHHCAESPYQTKIRCVYIHQRVRVLA